MSTSSINRYNNRSGLLLNNPLRLKWVLLPKSFKGKYNLTYQGMLRFENEQWGLNAAVEYVTSLIKRANATVEGITKDIVKSFFSDRCLCSVIFKLQAQKGFAPEYELQSNCDIIDYVRGLVEVLYGFQPYPYYKYVNALAMTRYYKTQTK